MDVRSKSFKHGRKLKVTLGKKVKVIAYKSISKFTDVKMFVLSEGFQFFSYYRTGTCVGVRRNRVPTKL